MSIPSTISEVSPAWLATQMNCTVDDIVVTNLGPGYMSDVFYLRADPANLFIVLKLSASSPERRELAHRFDSYRKEHIFYRDLAADIDIRLPRCHFNLMADDGHFALGLDYIQEGMSIDPDAGVDEEQMFEAMNTLARLHIYDWSTTDSNIPRFPAGFTAAAEDLASTSALPELFPTGATDLIQDYARNSLHYLPKFVNQTQVLSHMDFRLENLKFLDEGLTVLDWGEFSTAPQGFDIAYFMVTSVSSENRRKWERHALTTYLDAIDSEHFDLEQLIDSYRLCLLTAIYMPLLMYTAGNRTDARIVADRIACAVNDHANDIRRLLR